MTYREKSCIIEAWSVEELLSIVSINYRLLPIPILDAYEEHNITFHSNYIRIQVNGVWIDSTNAYLIFSKEYGLCFSTSSSFNIQYTPVIEVNEECLEQAFWVYDDAHKNKGLSERDAFKNVVRKLINN